MSLRAILEKELQQEKPKWSAIQQALTDSAQALDSRETALLGVVERLCSALRDGAYLDAAVLLRQWVRANGGITIPKSVWLALREHAETCGLIGLVQDGNAEISTRPWHPNWLDHANQMDVFARRSSNPSLLGDGMLNAMRPQWTDYRSEAQKAAVDAWLFAPPGSTTLVTLPTGAGKSLCILLPAWLNSRGGRLADGTTIVVVPTVALALDQEKQAMSFFRGDQPRSRTGANSYYERRNTEALIREGTLPVLYTSPESLLGTSLHQTCLEASEAGLITRFVIDEAHLVETWGAGFRPEFQMLATFRRDMLRRSRGRLKTLLLSATVSEKSRTVLEDLFSDDGRLITVEANRLRPEIAYWFNLAPNPSIREARVLEALHYLPRPLILYVTRPDQARDWERLLRDRGYQRIGVFTGKTTSEERLTLLEQWMGNAVDIMIGTSAFGLGVDKSDVRAVVHATLPENIDRFYQEVGRSGRDGFSAISLLCTCPEDRDIAFHLSPRRITYEKAEPRWRAMLAVSNRAKHGDERVVNRDAIPAGKHRDVVEIDRDWNDHILFLLQRAGAIKVLTAPPPETDEEMPQAHVRIQILDTRLIEDADFFRALFQQARDDELDAQPLNDLLEIIQMYSTSKADQCLAYRLADIYADVQVACGGCPHCREARQQAYGGATLDFRVNYPTTLQRTVERNADLSPVLQTKLGAWRSLNVTWSGVRSFETLGSILPLLPQLLKHGIQQFVLPDGIFERKSVGADLARAMAAQDREEDFPPHRLIPMSWLMERSRTPLLPLATAIVYPADEIAADQLFRAVQAAEKQIGKLPACIHVIYTALRLKGAGKLFTEHVDGLTESNVELQKYLKTE